MSKAVKYYLAGYNLTTYFFWLLFFLGYAQGQGRLNDSNIWLLNLAQGMAVLEIIHALLKWVKSPLGSTVAQVLSRLLVLGLIDAYFFKWDIVPAIETTAFLTAGITMAVLAWSITEIVRYLSYFTALINRQPMWLLWMRYSFFIVLYPLGVFGEWLIFLFVLIPKGPGLNLNTGIIAVLLVAYVLYFPKLYQYMWKQRKLKLG